MKSLFVRFVREDAGQDLIEYALIAGIISICAVATMKVLAPKISTLFTTIAGDLP
jgi:pilus assembly protein Flp/PilA